MLPLVPSSCSSSTISSASAPIRHQSSPPFVLTIHQFFIFIIIRNLQRCPPAVNPTTNRSIHISPVDDYRSHAWHPSAHCIDHDKRERHENTTESTTKSSGGCNSPVSSGGDGLEGIGDGDRRGGGKHAEFGGECVTETHGVVCED